MDILDYGKCANPAWWLKQIGDCDWAGAQYLHTLLAENRFHEICGEKARAAPRISISFAMVLHRCVRQNMQ